MLRIAAARIHALGRSAVAPSVAPAAAATAGRYAAAAFIVLHGRRRVQAESCTAAFRKIGARRPFCRNGRRPRGGPRFRMLSRCVARRADRRLRAALAAPARGARAAPCSRSCCGGAPPLRADAAYADAARRISDAETRTGFALAAAQDAEARAKAGRPPEKRPASAIAAAAQAAATAREAAATVAVEARERAMADLAALRAASARDVASVKADADAAVASAVAEEIRRWLTLVRRAPRR